MKRAWVRQIVRFVLHNLSVSEFAGLEYLPSSGGVIIATNHLSMVDTPLLFLNPPRPDITALVADKHQKDAFMRWFVESAEGIWIDRTRADFAAFREAIEVLKRGQALGIAPEGTRSETGQLQQGKPGTILLAIKSGAPIVPVGISGTKGGVKRIFTFQQPRFLARFGPAFHLPELGRENREEAMQALTDEIMCRIAALLPPEQHGFYSGHPRVAELIAAQASLPESPHVRA
jgi:1-acyl-sn-glycerol-3-phosphate acyltransferase